MTDTLESLLAKIVALGWSPSVRLVGERWHAGAGKRGSGAYVTSDGETAREALEKLVVAVEGWTR